MSTHLNGEPLNELRIIEKFDELRIIIENRFGKISEDITRLQRGKQVRNHFEATAIGYLVTRPDLTCCEIAEELGLCRKSLYRMKKFREIAIEMGKMKPRKGAQECEVPRGQKVEGRIEAEDHRQFRAHVPED